ncbi:MAG: hypothetical protein V2B19_03940 [Pseudomonadota bacterium]
MINKKMADLSAIFLFTAIWPQLFFSMTEIQMFQTVPVIEAMAMILFLTLGHSIFGFVSYFDIRISSFVGPPMCESCPQGSVQSLVLWARPGFFAKFYPDTIGMAYKKLPLISIITAIISRYGKHWP